MKIPVTGRNIKPPPAPSYLGFFCGSICLIEVIVKGRMGVNALSYLAYIRQRRANNLYPVWRLNPSLPFLNEDEDLRHRIDAHVFMGLNLGIT